jgi:hypothetical protein
VSLTRSGRFAMQKVVGSSPIIRFKRPANGRVALAFVITQNETLSQAVG